MVVAMVMTRPNRDEYRETAAERNRDKQSGNNFFHHFSPLNQGGK